ncbi:hypothetical protein [Marinicella litoralis]|uniref:hypothetical protein n=1 Tax=Marinicella litoralis TaxID=644220 RepID=UPI0013C2CD91|nr:hypothetical protein [Marinicella litoralis]
MKTHHLFSGLIFTFIAFYAHSANFIVDRFEDAPDDLPGNGVCAATNMVGAVCT